MNALQIASRSEIRSERIDPQTLELQDLAAPEIGRVALASGVELHELTPRAGDLEQVFFELTRDDELEGA